MFFDYQYIMNGIAITRFPYCKSRQFWSPKFFNKASFLLFNLLIIIFLSEEVTYVVVNKTNQCSSISSNNTCLHGRTTLFYSSIFKRVLNSISVSSEYLNIIYYIDERSFTFI